jgi:hypothetical protein
VFTLAVDADVDVGAGAGVSFCDGGSSCSAIAMIGHRLARAAVPSGIGPNEGRNTANICVAGPLRPVPSRNLARSGVN